MNRPTPRPSCLIAFVALFSCSEKGGEPGGEKQFVCSEHHDCLEAVDAHPERCAPKDWHCDAGVCKVFCAQPCQVVRQDFNPCDDATLLCNEPASGTELSFCTGRPIECSSASDCPLFRPSQDGDWTCDSEGVCRFPGFSYAYED